MRHRCETLPLWLRAASRLLAPDGIVTLIWRADGLRDVLAALADQIRRGRVAAGSSEARRAGDPGVGRAPPKEAARRSALLPGLVLADADGKPTAAAEAVLRGGAALALAET